VASTHVGCRVVRSSSGCAMTARLGEARLDRPRLLAAEAALEAHECPPIFCEDRLPPRPLRGPDCRFPTRLRTTVLNEESGNEGDDHDHVSIRFGQRRSRDRIAGSGPECEFGRGVGEALAHRFLEAEETDFLREARVQERWIGVYESIDADEIDRDRVSIFGRLDGKWFVAMMIVDRDGHAYGMIGKRELGGANRPSLHSRMHENSYNSGRGAVPGRHHVPALILIRDWEEERVRRKQEKGTVSRQVPSDCLHIVFPGDMARAPRDMLARIGVNPPLPARIREIRDHSCGPR
jgi:hypothetical protein